MARAILSFSVTKENDWCNTGKNKFNRIGCAEYEALMCNRKILHSVQNNNKLKPVLGRDRKSFHWHNVPLVNKPLFMTVITKSQLL
jgi:hypothetical protein